MLSWAWWLSRPLATAFFSHSSGYPRSFTLPFTLSYLHVRPAVILHNTISHSASIYFFAITRSCNQLLTNPHSCAIRAASVLCTGPHFHIPVSKPPTDLITGSLFRYDVLSAAGWLWIILSHSTIFVVLSVADSCGLFSIMLRDCFNCFFFPCLAL